MFRKLFLRFYFLATSVYSVAQPALSLDWEFKEPINRGVYIRHDNHNNIITIGTGGSNIFGNYVNLIVVKHDSAGNLLWERSFGDTIGGMLIPYDLKIDSADNIYLSGRAHQGLQFAEGFIVKYDSNGNFKWNRFFGADKSLTGDFNKMTLFNNSYIYVAGKMDSISGAGFRKGVLVKYSTDGNLIWAKADSVNYNQEGKTVEVDKAGNVYLIGFTSCCLPGGKFFVEKFDSSGMQKWKTVLIDTAYQYGFSTCSTIDDSASIYVAGRVQGVNVPTGFDAGVIKIDSIGNIKWFSSFVSDSSNQVWESPQGILVDKNYNAYVFGNGLGGFLFKLNSAGIQQWNTLGNGNGPNKYYVMVRSYLVNDTTIVSGAYGPTATSPGNFIAISTSTNGNGNWSLAYPYLNNSNTSYFDLTDDSTFYFTGLISDTNFVIEDSLFTIRLSRSLINIVAQPSSEVSVILYPNPFNDHITIHVGEDETLSSKVDIYNILGNKVFTSNTYETSSSFHLDYLAKGIYFLEVSRKGILSPKIKFIKY